MVFCGIAAELRQLVRCFCSARVTPPPPTTKTETEREGANFSHLMGCSQLGHSWCLLSISGMSGLFPPCPKVATAVPAIPAGLQQEQRRKGTRQRDFLEEPGDVLSGTTPICKGNQEGQLLQQAHYYPNTRLLQ